MIEYLSNDNKILKEKMNSLENELTQFKNGNLKLYDKFQSSNKIIDNLNKKMNSLIPNFINIDNPWTNEKEKGECEFKYILRIGTQSRVFSGPWNRKALWKEWDCPGSLFTTALCQ
jgi:predicted  nucleic acid-binding Zn-ribbon protein